MLWNEYISDVQSGKIVVGKYVRLAIERHTNDLDQAEKKGWYFCEDSARFAVDFIALIFRFYGKVSRKNLELQAFQAFIVAVLFGWKMADTDLRRFNKAYIEVARKNGKSFLIAAIGIYMTVADGEYDAEVYCAAMKRDQAMKVFRPAQQMMRALRMHSAGMKVATTVQKTRIIYEPGESFFCPLSRDYDTEEGSNPHCGIVDEVHVHPTTGMIDMLESGMVQRLQALLLLITTAGFDLSKPCFQYHKNYKALLEGTVQNDSTFAMIWCLDEGDDWQDEANWPKANPGLGTILPIANFRKELQKAQSEGKAKEQTFRVKNLNVWLNEATGWITDEDWRANSEPFSRESLAGRRCYLGIDLASTRDLTSTVLLFPPVHEGEPAKVLWFFYCPSAKIEKPDKNEGKVNYQEWAGSGLIFGTDGDATDYNYVFDHVNELRSEFDIVRGGFDRARALGIVDKLNEDGLDMHPVAQTYTGLTMPIEQIEHWIATGDFHHGDNPVANWMLGNVRVMYQGNDLKRINKSIASGKIDGFAALLDAVSVYLDYHEEDEDSSPIFTLA